MKEYAVNKEFKNILINKGFKEYNIDRKIYFKKSHNSRICLFYNDVYIRLLNRHVFYFEKYKFNIHELKILLLFFKIPSYMREWLECNCLFESYDKLIDCLVSYYEYKKEIKDLKPNRDAKRALRLKDIYDSIKI